MGLAEQQNEDEGYDQGAFRWDRLERRKSRVIGPRTYIDVVAFKRLHERGYDGRPSDAKAKIAR